MYQVLAHVAEPLELFVSLRAPAVPRGATPGVLRVQLLAGCSRTHAITRRTAAAAAAPGEEVWGGRVKNAIFGGIFGGSHKIDADIHTDADQAELIAFLRENGFGKYATEEYIAKLDDVLAYDSIETTRISSPTMNTLKSEWTTRMPCRSKAVPSVRC